MRCETWSLGEATTARRMLRVWVEMASPKKIIWIIGGMISIMRNRGSRKTWVSSFLKKPRMVWLKIMVPGPS
jgi:hypothetical protein